MIAQLVISTYFSNSTRKAGWGFPTSRLSWLNRRWNTARSKLTTFYRHAKIVVFIMLENKINTALVSDASARSSRITQTQPAEVLDTFRGSYRTRMLNTAPDRSFSHELWARMLGGKQNSDGFNGPDARLWTAQSVYSHYFHVAISYCKGLFYSMLNIVYLN